MSGTNFIYNDEAVLKQAGVDAEFLDLPSEVGCRQMLAEGIAKYATCQAIVEPLRQLPDGKQLHILCTKQTGSYYHHKLNAVLIDQTHDSRLHLVQGSKDIVIPSLVCLFHELGHAKQFHENPIWFEATLSVRDENSVPYQIEYDNLHRHEDPLLRELGLPIRQRYEYFVSEQEAARKLKGAA